MRLTSVDALASRQALNRNPSLDLALVSCSDSLACTVARLIGIGERVHECFEALLHHGQVLFLAHRDREIASDSIREATKRCDHLRDRHFTAYVSLEQRECRIEGRRRFWCRHHSRWVQANA